MTPWQVRYVRWWHVREARYHTACSADPCRYADWHRAQAVDALRVSRRIRPHYLRTGALPLVVVDEQTAIARMRGAESYPEPTHRCTGGFP